MDDLTDQELISYALQHWANYIETGFPSLSAQDLRNMQKGFLIKNLGEDQVKLVVRLKRLAVKEYKK